MRLTRSVTRYSLFVWMNRSKIDVIEHFLFVNAAVLHFQQFRMKVGQWHCAKVIHAQNNKLFIVFASFKIIYRLEIRRFLIVIKSKSKLKCDKNDLCSYANHLRSISDCSRQPRRSAKTLCSISTNSRVRFFYCLAFFSAIFRRF